MSTLVVMLQPAAEGTIVPTGLHVDPALLRGLMIPFGNGSREGEVA